MMTTDVRTAVADTIQDIIADYKDAPETDREALIERLDAECDTLFGSLVMHGGRICDYDVDDLIATAGPCAEIIRVAQEDAWVEEDRGLWEGVTYGMLACVAYFSLRNLLYQALADAGHDTNDDLPFGLD
jgi:hypothetical protein